MDDDTRPVELDVEQYGSGLYQFCAKCGKEVSPLERMYETEDGMVCQECYYKYYADWRIM